MTTDRALIRLHSGRFTNHRLDLDRTRLHLRLFACLVRRQCEPVNRSAIRTAQHLQPGDVFPCLIDRAFGDHRIGLLDQRQLVIGIKLERFVVKTDRLAAKSLRVHRSRHLHIRTAIARIDRQSGFIPADGIFKRTFGLPGKIVNDVRELFK